MSKPSLLILAAGIGSRYGGFKQIDPVGPNREIIIDYSVYDALRAGFGKIAVVTAPELEEPIREHFAEMLGCDFPLEFAFQKLDDLPAGYVLPEGRKKPWGTGHAIWAARHIIHEPFGVINADDFYGPTSYQVLAQALAEQKPGDCCMVGFELANTLSEHGTVSRGICQTNGDGTLREVVENTTIKPDATHGALTQQESGEWKPLAGNSIASMNFWGFDPTLFAHLEAGFCTFLDTQAGNLKAEYFIPSVVDSLIKSGATRCKVYQSNEQWFGMTYKEDRDLAAAAVQKLLDAGVYPASLKGR